MAAWAAHGLLALLWLGFSHGKKKAAPAAVLADWEIVSESELGFGINPRRENRRMQ